MKNVLITVGVIFLMMIVFNIINKSTFESENIQKPQKSKSLVEKKALDFDVIKSEQLGGMVEVQLKITNISGRHIRSAEVVLIAKDSNNKDIAFDEHYAIKGSKGGLAAGESNYQPYFFTNTNINDIKYWGFKISSIDF